MSNNKGLIIFISITVVHYLNAQLNKLTENLTYFS